MSALARELLLEKELANSRARRGLLAFIVRTYPQFKPSWHHARIATLVDCMHARMTVRQTLHALGMTDAEIELSAKRPHEVTGLFCGMTNSAMLDKPLMNAQVWVSPRSGKTEIISRRAPAYWLGRRPNATIIACSFGADLAQQNNRDVQRVMDDPIYREIFPAAMLPGKNVRTVASGAYLRNADLFEIVNHRGFYKCAGVGGSITGRGVNFDGVGLVDDPIRSREDAESPTKRYKLGEWIFGTYMSRLEMGARQFLLNTRWHIDDASGQTVAKAKSNPDASQWFVLAFPALLDCEPGPGDPRKFGETIWAERFPVSRLNEIRATSEYEFNSQHQQRPVSKEGSYIKLAWIKRYEALPADLTDWTMSVDLTFKDRNDYNAFTVWARKGPDHFLVDVVEKRIEFTEQVQVFLMLLKRHPQITTCLVEEAANANALISMLRKTVPGLIAIRAKTSKELRVQAVSPMFEAGNVHVPVNAPWADRFIMQLINFPADAHDDLVDSTSMYLVRAQQRTADYTKLRGISLARADSVDWRR